MVKICSKNSIFKGNSYTTDENLGTFSDLFLKMKKYSYVFPKYIFHIEYHLNLLK